MAKVKVKAFKGGLYGLKGAEVTRIGGAIRREEDLKQILQRHPKLIPNTQDVT